MRPPISYYGGKQSLLHSLLPMIPRHIVYTETFFGGGSLFWAKNPAGSETINDRLDIVVNFYRVLKTRYTELRPLIEESLISRTMHTEALRICTGKIDCTYPVKRAWAFWYAANFSFAHKIGGGAKYSNDQHTSMPAILRAKKRDFTELLVARIESAYIENNDALRVLNSRNVSSAFHYLDPPYMGADQGHYKGYNEQDFTALLDWCENECKGAFLISNYPSEVLLQYTQRNGWNSRYLDHSSKHGAHVRHRKKDEIVVWNYREPSAQQITIFD